MDVIVTGASGFIGRRLVPFLIEAGHQVHALRRPSTSFDFSTITQLPAENIHEYCGRIEEMEAIFRRVQPSCVIHLATHYVANHEIKDIDPICESILQLPLHLAECSVHSGCRRMVVAGTNWQRDEDSSFAPRSLYTAAKEAAENLLSYYAVHKEIAIDILYMYDTYAADDHRKKVLQMLIDAAISGQLLKMSPGHQRIDLVHVQDVCRAVATVLDRFLESTADRPPIQRYGVRSGNPLSLRDLVGVIENVLGRTIHVEWGAFPYREPTIMQPWEDSALIPGWLAQASLEDGIREIANQRRL